MGESFGTLVNYHRKKTFAIVKLKISIPAKSVGGKIYAIISAIDKRWVLIERRKMKSLLCSLRSLEETLKAKKEGRR